MDGQISIALIVGAILAIGFALGLADRENFAPSWLALAGLLIFVNDAALTDLYGVVPNLLTGAGWNWQGKLLALALPLAVAATALFGWRRCGLTIRQAPESLPPAGLVLVLYVAIFLAVALALPSGPLDPETLAFQASLPGIEEELFYRGILLFAFDRALGGRIRFLGVAWGWGAMLSSLAFGLSHAFGWSAESGASFDPVYFALTAGPSLIAVWLRTRTGSLLFPVLAHNLGNTLPLVL